jgi:hypothetical protein
MSAHGSQMSGREALNKSSTKEIDDYSPEPKPKVNLKVLMKP